MCAVRAGAAARALNPQVLPTLRRSLANCNRRRLARAVLRRALLENPRALSDGTKRRTALARVVGAVGALVEAPSGASSIGPERVLLPGAVLVRRANGSPAVAEGACAASLEGPRGCSASVAAAELRGLPWEEALGYRVWPGGGRARHYALLADAVWALTFYGYTYDAARYGRERAAARCAGTVASAVSGTSRAA